MVEVEDRVDAVFAEHELEVQQRLERDHPDEADQCDHDHAATPHSTALPMRLSVGPAGVRL